MRRVVVSLSDCAERLKKSVLARDWERNPKELRSLDLVAKFRSLFERAVMVGYIALRSGMVWAIASSTMRSIRSPWDISGFARRAAIANSARLSSHGFGFTSMT
jgi:hypothetical protein